MGVLRVLLRLLPLLAAAGGFSVSDRELRAVAERLHASDRDRAAPGDIVLNLQHRVPDGQSGAGHDYAPEK